MKKIIEVDVTADPARHMLIVDGEEFENSIKIDANLLSGTTIQWNLQRGANGSAAFKPIDNDSAKSGFFWTGKKPSWLTFGRPIRQTNTQITIRDYHPVRGGEKEWPYKLRANVGETECETNPPGSNRTPGDPKIKNR
jgi:hypothetical protein